MLFSRSPSYIIFFSMYSASLFVCIFFLPFLGGCFSRSFLADLFSHIAGLFSHIAGLFSHIAGLFCLSLLAYVTSLLSVSSHVCYISFVCLFSFLFLFVAGGMWGVRGGVLAGMQQRAQAWGLWRHKLDDVRVRVRVCVCVCVLDSLICYHHVCVAVFCTVLHYVALCCIQRKCRDAF